MNLSLLALVVAAMAADDAAAASRYFATRIPQVEYYNTSADAISASGDIAGNITLTNDAYGDEENIASFVFSAGNEFVRIVLPPEIVPPNSVTSAYGINSQGVVIGTVYDAGVSRAFWYAGSAGVSVGEAGSVATAINDANALAGYQRGHAFVASAEGGIYMPPDDSYAFGINSLGDITGTFRTGRSNDAGNPTYHVFRYRNGAFEALGALGDYAYGFGINANGDVVGATYPDDGGGRPFIHADGAMRYLGDARGSAQAINAAGTVVGYQYGTNSFRVFVYAEGAIGNLADLVDGLEGARLVAASAINDRGQIAARACAVAPGGECFGVRLDPVALAPQVLESMRKPR